MPALHAVFYLSVVLAMLLISDKIVFLRGIQKQQHPPVFFKEGIQFNCLASHILSQLFLNHLSCCDK